MPTVFLIIEIILSGNVSINPYDANSADLFDAVLLDPAYDPLLTTANQFKP